MTAGDPLNLLHPATQTWFGETFEAPTLAQKLGWPEIVAGRSTLLFAPTGAGKTLAAFLVAIDRLMFDPVPARAQRCRILYVSPLRALAVDVERNLRVPLEGIARAAGGSGISCHPPQVGVRTGDTSQNERARQRRSPPDILVTTPESLYLLLTSQAREILAPVRTVIVDEIHALVATKRGAHLALSLERLQSVAGGHMQRIGLSATQRPLEEVARFLGGYEPGGSRRLRAVQIVDARSARPFELRVEVPVEDLAHPGESQPPGPDGRQRRSVWPAIHPRLLELIRQHRSTIVFVNSRRLAERLAAALNELAGEVLARAHHGSIAREQRLDIERALKEGRLPALVATSSLELGIDMGAVDLVVQVESPPSVASGLQRVGRSGHRLGAVSRGVIFPKFRGDLLAVAALTRAMADFEVEATRVPRNPLDVLAQQLVSLCVEREWRVDELFDLVSRAAPFSDLARGQFEDLLDLLSGRYPADDFAELRPRLVWDRVRGRVRARDGARLLAVTNAGTIPDRGLYGVFLAADPGAPGARGGRRVGELDEEMVFESRIGEVFMLGASSWRIVEITHERVLVEPAPGQPGKLPFWKADAPPRPVELGRAIGRLTRELLAEPEDAALARLEGEHFLDARAAHNLLAYLLEQRAATGVVPDDRQLVLERGRDELGDWRLCLLSPLGGRVHAPWALALQAHLRRRGSAEAETVWSDDGIVVRLPDSERAPDARELLPEPEELESLVTSELQGSPLFAATFREAAGRALLLPRRRPGQRTPLWRQRKRAADLLQVAARHPDFPLLLEAYRECLQDLFDLPALIDVAQQVRDRSLRLHTVDTLAPSPFASTLLFGYVANYLYEGDAPLAERKAQALVVDPRKLRELLGEAELRELLDPQVLEEHERTLQCLAEGRRARSADRVHDLLLRLGDLSAAEVQARSEPGAEDWLLCLAAEGRVLRVRIGGEERYVAAEDAGRLRDALGLALPPGLPPAFLESVPFALEDLLARFARTHGPFHAQEPARRLGAEPAAIDVALQALARRGRLLEGEFRPGGQGAEWCDAEVLQALRRRSLAALRRAVEPAEPQALGRLLSDWQGVGSRTGRTGADALLDVVEQLQGAALPASLLEREILPARLPDYRPQDLDLACAAGEVLWVGRGRLGERDGRLALYLPNDLSLLGGPSGPPLDGERHEAIRRLLRERGASFFPDLHAGLGGLERELLEALWDLIWCGEVVGDSPTALRAFLRPADRRRGPLGQRPSLRTRRVSPPAGSGRFSLLESRLALAATPTPTECLAAQAEQLLARWGVLTRDAVLAEEQAGGFSALYPVLRAMEEAGRVRRGYFVSGLGAAQFAEPGALERLRELRERATESETTAQVLAACDPANPYGTALPWPRGEARLARSAGAQVILAEGELVAYASPAERDLLTFLPENEPEHARVALALASALHAWLERSGRLALPYETVDGVSLPKSPLASFLGAAGFAPYGLGFRLAAPRALKP